MIGKSESYGSPNRSGGYVEAGSRTVLHKSFILVNAIRVSNKCALAVIPSHVISVPR